MTPDLIDRIARLMHETARQYRDGLGVDRGPRLLVPWEQVPPATLAEYRCVARAILSELSDRLCDEPAVVEARP